MMISELYIWVWLPKATQPVVAGKLTAFANQWQFNYGQSYLKRPDAIALYTHRTPFCGFLASSDGLLECNSKPSIGSTIGGF